MNAKEKVRAIYPRARHRRYKTAGNYTYTLIWDGMTEHKRLGEGKTTATAWHNAAKHLPKVAPKVNVWGMRPHPGDEWEFQLPEQRKKRKIVASIGRVFVGRNADGSSRRRMHVSWQRKPKGRYSGLFVKSLLKYGRRISTKAQRDAALQALWRKKGIL